MVQKFYKRLLKSKTKNSNQTQPGHSLDPLQVLSNPGESVGVARLASSGGDEACHANLGKVQLGYKHFKLSTWVHLLPPSDCLMFRVPPLSPWYYIVFSSISYPRKRNG